MAFVIPRYCPKHVFLNLCSGAIDSAPSGIAFRLYTTSSLNFDSGLDGPTENQTMISTPTFSRFKYVWLWSLRDAAANLRSIPLNRSFARKLGLVTQIIFTLLSGSSQNDGLNVYAIKGIHLICTLKITVAPDTVHRILVSSDIYGKIKIIFSSFSIR